MSVIRLSTLVPTNVGKCFDIARSLRMHQDSMAHTKERLVNGPTHDLAEVGDVITWEPIHFGIKQQLQVQITQMEAPHSFTDEMVRGAFRSMKHQHLFHPTEKGTIMEDIFAYTTPYGLAGRIFDILVLKSYMTRLLDNRNRHIVAEALQGAALE